MSIRHKLCLPFRGHDLVSLCPDLVEARPKGKRLLAELVVMADPGYVVARAIV